MSNLEHIKEKGGEAPYQKETACGTECAAYTLKFEVSKGKARMNGEQTTASF